MNVSALLLYMFVQSSTPGPNNFMCMFSAAQYGFKGALRYITGSVTGFVIKMVLCGMLSLALAVLIPSLVPYLKWVGGAYLVYLAVHIILDARKPANDSDKEGGSTFMSGILLQCLNIKSWIYCLTLYTVYIIPYTTSQVTMILWCLIAVGFMIPTSLCYAVFGHAIRRVYSKYRMACGIVFALALIYCAIIAVA